jgi:hypothetical protein
VLTENLWPKLFSEAPRCAPLRLADSKASGVPSRKAFKIKENEIFGLVGIACPGKELLQAPRCKPWPRSAVENGFLWFGVDAVRPKRRRRSAFSAKRFLL